MASTCHPKLMIVQAFQCYQTRKIFQRIFRPVNFVGSKKTAIGRFFPREVRSWGKTREKSADLTARQHYFLEFCLKLIGSIASTQTILSTPTSNFSRISVIGLRNMVMRHLIIVCQTRKMTALKKIVFSFDILWNNNVVFTLNCLIADH